MMMLLTKEVRDAMPPLYSTQDVPERDKRVAVKFFTPDAQWTWYAVEGGTLRDGECSHTGGNGCQHEPLSQWKPGEDALFFGLVDGFEREWGYFTLNELLKVRGQFGLPIERDRYFEGTIGSLR